METIPIIKLTEKYSYFVFIVKLNWKRGYVKQLMVKHTHYLLIWNTLFWAFFLTFLCPYWLVKSKSFVKVTKPSTIIKSLPVYQLWQSLDVLLRRKRWQCNLFEFWVVLNHF